jgi:hypothetical protein
LLFNCNANSQQKDSTVNKKYIEKITQLYGQDASYSGPLTIKEI